MALLQLPPEILIEVMDYVGSCYFREDMRRLTVCRQWFSFARTACFKDLQLSQKSLQRLFSAHNVEKSLLLVKESSEALGLELRGFEDWGSITEPQTHPLEADAFVTSSWASYLGRAMIAAWTTRLDDNLSQLATTARESRKLRVLRVQASSERHPLLPYLPRRDYLSLSTVRSLLLGKNLSILELDLCGTYLMLPQEQPDDFHVCTSIGALLTTLRRLRLRMRSLCPDVLKPHHHDTSLRLSEVLINLSLSEDPSIRTLTAHSTRCGHTGGGFLKLKADIETQAKALAEHMECPKTIRILTHTLPQLKVRSLDVLNGKCMELDDVMEWGDDGKTVEDDSDSRSEISDDISSISSDE